MKPWIPQLRAIFVLFHLVAVTLMAAPAPAGGMKRAAWKDPTVQAELRAWRDRLSGLGLDRSPEAFEQDLWELAAGFMRVRRQVLRPFRPYYRWCGTWQTWRMFIAPHRFPARLHIELSDGGGDYRSVYVARSPEHTWLAPQLDQARMRAALFRYGWPSYGRSWSQLADWIAARAAADFPEAERIRLRMWKYRTPSPEQVLAGERPEGRWVNVQLRALEPLRRGDP